MALDLSALDRDFGEASPAVAADAGRPLLLAMELIDEDPQQPRTEFEDGALQELADDIRLRGVLQPVSVRPHPQQEGRWMLNFGARRYRASRMAGKDEIPAFVDERLDDFAQVAENEQRDSLKAMELALFIQRKIDDGLKKKEIAQKLHKPATAIADYLALLAAPESVLTVYREGRCSSVRTLADLCKRHESQPAETDDWLAAHADVEITRQMVLELSTGTTDRVEEVTSIMDGAQALDADIPTEAPSPALDEVSQGDDDRKDGSFPHPMSPDLLLLKKPMLLGVFNGRAVMLLLNRRPNAEGTVFIQYEDNGEAEEVDIGQIRLNLLKDMKKGD